MDRAFPPPHDFRRYVDEMSDEANPYKVPVSTATAATGSESTGPNDGIGAVKTFGVTFLLYSVAALGLEFLCLHLTEWPPGWLVYRSVGLIQRVVILLIPLAFVLSLLWSLANVQWTTVPTSRGSVTGVLVGATIAGGLTGAICSGAIFWLPSRFPDSEFRLPDTGFVVPIATATALAFGSTLVFHGLARRRVTRPRCAVGTFVVLSTISVSLGFARMLGGALAT